MNIKFSYNLTYRFLVGFVPKFNDVELKDLGFKAPAEGRANMYHNSMFVITSIWGMNSPTINIDGKSVCVILSIVNADRPEQAMICSKMKNQSSKIIRGCRRCNAEDYAEVKRTKKFEIEEEFYKTLNEAIETRNTNSQVLLKPTMVFSTKDRSYQLVICSNILTKT